MTPFWQFWDKNFDKILIAALFLYVFTAWVKYGVAEVRDISRDLIIAIVALASVRRNTATTEINTASMDDATITANPPKDKK